MKPEYTATPHSTPLFSANVEAKAAEALNVLIFSHGGGDEPLREDQLLHVRAAFTALVDCLFPINGDHADFSGADSLDGVDYVHPMRVAGLAAVIGRTMGMQHSELVSLAMAAALMNVGYLALRRSLLDQPRRLLEGEWEEHVHTHPGRAVAMLGQSGLSKESLETIAHHHERWDGSGYPDGVRRDAISRYARILGVADSYVSLRSIRPYRPPVDADGALEAIAADRDTLFDPDVVDAFEDVIARFNGIVRAGRAAAASASAQDATSDVALRFDPPAGDADVDDAVGAPPAPTSDAGELDEAPAPQRGRVPVSQVVGRADLPPIPRQAVAAPTPITPASVTPAPPRQPPSRARAQESRTIHSRPTRRRRPAPKTRARSRTLFATRLYLDAAVNGRWRGDFLNR